MSLRRKQPQKKRADAIDETGYRVAAVSGHVFVQFWAVPDNTIPYKAAYQIQDVQRVGLEYRPVHLIGSYRVFPSGLLDTENSR